MVLPISYKLFQIEEKREHFPILIILISKPSRDSPPKGSKVRRS